MASWLARLWANNVVLHMMPVGISGGLLAVLGGLLVPLGVVVPGAEVLVPGLVGFGLVGLGLVGFGLVGLGLVGFVVFGRSWAAQGDVSPPISATENIHCDALRILNIDSPLALNAIYQSILHHWDASHNISCAKNAAFFGRFRLDGCIFDRKSKAACGSAAGVNKLLANVHRGWYNKG